MGGRRAALPIRLVRVSLLTVVVVVVAASLPMNMNIYVYIYKYIFGMFAMLHSAYLGR